MHSNDNTSWSKLIQSLGKEFEDGAVVHDAEDRFVSENYDLLRKHRFFAATIPKELGGGGLPHSEMCELIRQLGQHCSSTALANSMHQHLLAAMVWKYRKGSGGRNPKDDCSKTTCYGKHRRTRLAGIQRRDEKSRGRL